MPVFTEKSTVEDYIIEKLKERGWKYIPGEELEREDYAEPLLINDFIRSHPPAKAFLSNARAKFLLKARADAEKPAILKVRWGG